MLKIARSRVPDPSAASREGIRRPRLLEACRIQLKTCMRRHARILRGGAAQQAPPELIVPPFSESEVMKDATTASLRIFGSLCCACCSPGPPMPAGPEQGAEAHLGPTGRRIAAGCNIRPRRSRRPILPAPDRTSSRHAGPRNTSPAVGQNADGILPQLTADYLTRMIERTTPGCVGPCPACRAKGLPWHPNGQWFVVGRKARSTDMQRLQDGLPERISSREHCPAKHWDPQQRFGFVGGEPFRCHGYLHARPSLSGIIRAAQGEPRYRPVAHSGPGLCADRRPQERPRRQGDPPAFRRGAAQDTVLRRIRLRRIRRLRPPRGGRANHESAARRSPRIRRTARLESSMPVIGQPAASARRAWTARGYAESRRPMISLPAQPAMAPLAVYSEHKAGANPHRA